ncbi:MAG: hypothetical protein OXF01_07970 [Gemmatimonadetes bacterium]|nr:hypothetical protein [Gemmatimonadota bacterium]
MIGEFFSWYFGALVDFWGTALRLGLPQIVLLILILMWLRGKRSGKCCCTCGKCCRSNGNACDMGAEAEAEAEVEIEVEAEVVEEAEAADEAEVAAEADDS